MINQAKLKNARTRPVYKYRFQIPRNHAEAVKIDKKFGNTKWVDAEKLEIKQLMEYEAFKDLGPDADIQRYLYTLCMTSNMTDNIRLA